MTLTTPTPSQQLNEITSLFPLEWRRQWHPTPVLLPGKSHGRRSLVGCSPWGRWGSDTTERLHFHFPLETFTAELNLPSWFWRTLSLPSSQWLVFYLKAAFSFLPTLASWCWFLSGEQLNLSLVNNPFLRICPGRITVVMGSVACLHSHRDLPNKPDNNTC